MNTRIPLWTWSGVYFGYREGDNLWSHGGRLVGRFYGDEVYGSDGAYLGEIRDGDRLIRQTRKERLKKPRFTVRLRGASGVRGMRGGRGMPGGYEEFPEESDD